MKAGMFLRKVKSRMWKRQRHYKLQEDCKTIAYKSSWAINSYSTCKPLWSIIIKLKYILIYIFIKLHKAMFLTSLLDRTLVTWMQTSHKI